MAGRRVVVVDDVLAPPSLRTIIDELDFAYWSPTEIGWRQASGAFKRGVSLGRRGESTSEVWFGEGASQPQPLTACSGGRTDICPPAVGIFGNPNRNRSPNARTRTSRTRTGYQPNYGEVQCSTKHFITDLRHDNEWSAYRRSSKSRRVWSLIVITGAGVVLKVRFKAMRRSTPPSSREQRVLR